MQAGKTCFDAGREGRGRGRGGVGEGQDKHVPQFLWINNYTRLHARPLLLRCRVAVLEQWDQVAATKVVLGDVLRQHPPPSPVLETKTEKKPSPELSSARTKDAKRFRGAGSASRPPQNERLDTPRSLPVRPQKIGTVRHSSHANYLSFTAKRKKIMTHPRSQKCPIHTRCTCVVSAQPRDTHGSLSPKYSERDQADTAQLTPSPSARTCKLCRKPHERSLLKAGPASLAFPPPFSTSDTAARASRARS